MLAVTGVARGLGRSSLQARSHSFFLVTLLSGQQGHAVKEDVPMLTAGLGQQQAGVACCKVKAMASGRSRL